MPKKDVFAGIMSGLSAIGTILEPPRYPKVAGSDMSRLRGDVARIGGDFGAVMKREHGKENNEQIARDPKGCAKR